MLNLLAEYVSRLVEALSVFSLNVSTMLSKNFLVPLSLQIVANVLRPLRKITGLAKCAVCGKSLAISMGRLLDSSLL